MNRYRLTNTETGEVVEKEAEYLDQAIREVDWQRANCHFEILPAQAEKVAPKESPEKPKATRKKKTAKKEETAEVEEVATATVGGSVKAETVATYVVSEPTEAEATAYGHKQEIESLAIAAEVMFLKMGQLLYGARVNGEWSILHYESYREYCEDLKLPVSASYSWATRLSAIYEYLVKNMKLDEKLLAEIGVAKLTRLLPLARNGELTLEVLEAARILSDLDLRVQLGHEVGNRGDEPDLVICPRCGESFNAKTATRSK